MCKCLDFNCDICCYYKYEELGDSDGDFGMRYAEKRTCSKDKDFNMETEEYIKDFDYESIKNCCVPEFLIVADKDEELVRLYNEDINKLDDMYDIYKSDVYKRFKEKYKSKDK